MITERMVYSGWPTAVVSRGRSPSGSLLKATIWPKKSDRSREDTASQLLINSFLPAFLRGWAIKYCKSQIVWPIFGGFLGTRSTSLTTPPCLRKTGAGGVTDHLRRFRVHHRDRNTRFTTKHSKEHTRAVSTVRWEPPSVAHSNAKAILHGHFVLADGNAASPLTPEWWRMLSSVVGLDGTRPCRWMLDVRD